MGYYIKVEPNVKIYVEDLNPEGNRTIVFLHGWPGSHKLFEYQFDQLPKMGYRCVGIDTRGFGNSDKPWTGYGYDRLSDDVRCVVEALKLHDFTLVGHSTGGAMAVRYMARHKGHGVSKLALIDAAAPSLIKRPNFPYGLEKEDVIKIIQGTYTDRPKMLRDFGDTFFFQYITGPLSDWFFQLGLQAAGWATVAIENTWINEVLFSDLETINVPTLIIHGIHDKVVPFELGEIQNKMIRHSKFIPFKYSGHATFYDERDKFNKELVKFIEE
ncbi:alpha/beta hydrolase [Clostridium botulinum]|uniref:Alpha/beta hydrolase n=2 Tax=Clostridium botulinum TaxID=1491 RepID=A0A846I0N2_CLOBO|nr:alpha/beta hydrolase [Clostridium botulinum]AJD28251.1 alpha/beta hydrolase fold family protein [Clostridium botulinum CDC_297]EPS50015.1 alpha/beta fold family hydrolase [Clostridium botulinum A1 str. CFSAN002368]ACQ54397.1 non-heme haloperoxidase family protein [Clostridium botulinum Ba4 str. 657]MBY6875699.1 alpha/beta hydrolase [Clostridium botulinum]MBY6890645.1 alpha/beta hydrolase [Clostridium botulinum]